MRIELKVPISKKDEFKRICQENGVKYYWDPALRCWGIEQPNKETPIPEFLCEFSIGNKKARYFVIDCDYSYYPFAAKAGARWDAEHKCAIYRGTTLPTELTGFEPKPFSYQEKVEKALNNEPIKSLAPQKSFKPHNHQKDAAGQLLRAWKSGQPGFLLADETGLGKTAATWLGILEITKTAKKPLKILVTGPLGAISVWRETIEWLGNGSVKNEANDIILLNYERLKYLFHEDKKKAKTIKGLARFAKAESFDLVIFDESHYLKSPKTARTKLARSLESQAKFSIWLSATAGQNPLELSYLSNLLAYSTGDTKKSVDTDYEKWCQAQGINLKRGQFGKWIYEGTQEDNKILYKILFVNPHIALRRRCSQIAGWPELQRIPSSYDLSAQEVQAYQTAWDEFLKAVEEDKLGRLQGKKDLSKGLAQLTRLRQKASILRIENTVELAEELVENGYQVAISVEYLRSLDLIKEALEKKGYKVGEFSGRNASLRENERKAYQKGLLDVIIFSTESSISLHQENDTDKPRTQINHDLRWSGIEQEQVDGRSHRNGRHAPVYWCFSKNTVEERVAKILLSKLESMNTLRGDDCSFASIYKHITM